MNLIVVGSILILQFINEIEYNLYLRHIPSRPNPQLALGILKALSFDFLHLVYGIVSLLAPLQFLIQKVEHGEIKTPQVVSSTQIDVVVRVEGRETHGAAEVGFAASR